MKIFSYFILFSLLLNVAYAAEIKGFINDEANIINPTEEAQIKAILEQLYNSKTAEFAIVTVKNLEGKDIESFALNLAQGKLGDKEKNNGLLLLVSLEDKKYRFEVGRGIEPILNDAKIGRIGRNYLVPNFQQNDYGKGILETSLAVSSTLQEKTDSKYYVATPKNQIQNNFSNYFSLFIFFIVISSIIGSLTSKSTNRKRDRFFDAALMAGLLFGGRGRGGGGLGGFGGFGGGSFGGGGAGGSW